MQLSSYPKTWKKDACFLKGVLQLCFSLVKIETIWKCFWHKTKFKTSKPFSESIWNECHDIQSFFFFFNYFSLCDFDLVQYSKIIPLNNSDELFPTKGLFQSLLLLETLLGTWSDSNSASSCHSHEFSLQRITLILYSILSLHLLKIESFSHLKDECSN